MSIVVHIDELILHDFAPRDRVQIAAALAGELERLIAARGVPVGLVAENGAAALDAGAFVVPPGTRPQLIGTQIAQSVYNVKRVRQVDDEHGFTTADENFARASSV